MTGLRVPAEHAGESCCYCLFPYPLFFTLKRSGMIRTFLL
jgi:hypothetical protein